MSSFSVHGIRFKLLIWSTGRSLTGNYPARWHIASTGAIQIAIFLYVKEGHFYKAQANQEEGEQPHSGEGWRGSFSVTVKENLKAKNLQANNLRAKTLLVCFSNKFVPTNCWSLAFSMNYDSLLLGLQALATDTGYRYWLISSITYPKDTHSISLQLKKFTCVRIAVFDRISPTPSREWNSFSEWTKFRPDATGRFPCRWANIRKEILQNLLSTHLFDGFSSEILTGCLAFSRINRTRISYWIHFQSNRLPNGRWPMEKEIRAISLYSQPASGMDHRLSHCLNETV